MRYLSVAYRILFTQRSRIECSHHPIQRPPHLSMLSRRMFLGKPKPPGLGVGTKHLYVRGLNICFPLVEDRLVRADSWNPLEVFPRIMPEIQAKSNDRALEYAIPQYTSFVTLWSAVSLTCISISISISTAWTLLTMIFDPGWAGPHWL